MLSVDNSYALLLIDIWDQHWCRGATQRVGELVPTVNQVITYARNQGALIIHAPSSTMAYYDNIGSQARQTAKAARTSLPHYDPLRIQLPIDDSDQGCDDTPKCTQGQPWKREHEGIIIYEEKDAITDNLEEIYGLFKLKNIKKVITMGVHVNMCILHTRSFSLNTLVALKQIRELDEVFLMGDLTDSMYNHLSAPVVNHFAGTDLVVRYILDEVCPTMLSSEFTGRDRFRFGADQRPLHGDWLQGTVQFMCLGIEGGLRWLKAENNRVFLENDRDQATHWSLVEIGPSLYALQGAQEFLGGNPEDGNIYLQNNLRPTGSKWYVEQVVPNGTGNSYTLKCCGRYGDRRYLDGDARDGNVSLQNDPSRSGTKWQIEISPRI